MCLSLHYEALNRCLLFFLFFFVRQPEKNTLMDLEWLLPSKQLVIKDICNAVSLCAARSWFFFFFSLLLLYQCRALWEKFCLADVWIENMCTHRLTDVHVKINKQGLSHWGKITVTEISLTSVMPQINGLFSIHFNLFSFQPLLSFGQIPMVCWSYVWCGSLDHNNNIHWR